MFGQGGCGLHGWHAVFAGVHCAHHTLDGSSEDPRFFDVWGSPDRAFGIVQDLRRHRAEQKSTKDTHAVGGHGDQVRFVFLGVLDDILGWIAFEHDTGNAQTLEAVLEKAVQVALPALSYRAQVDHGGSESERLTEI